MWRFSLPHGAITFCFYDAAILGKQDFNTLKARFQVVLVSLFPSLFAFEPLIRKLQNSSHEVSIPQHISLRFPPY